MQCQTRNEQLYKLKENMMNDIEYTKRGLLTRILFLIIWPAFLIFLVDGLGLFSILSEKLGYATTEALLWFLLFIPIIPIIKYCYRYYRSK